jgi:hypothetical protein
MSLPSRDAPEYALMQPRLRIPPPVSLEPNTGLDIIRTIWLNMQHSMEYPSIDGFWYLQHAALCVIITNGSRYWKLAESMLPPSSEYFENYELSTGD